MQRLWGNCQVYRKSVLAFDYATKLGTTPFVLGGHTYKHKHYWFVTVVLKNVEGHTFLITVIIEPIITICDYSSKKNYGLFVAFLTSLGWMAFTAGCVLVR